jgi:hypothetical protein
MENIPRFENAKLALRVAGIRFEHFAPGLWNLSLTPPFLVSILELLKYKTFWKTNRSSDAKSQDFA